MGKFQFCKSSTNQVHYYIDIELGQSYELDIWQISLCKSIGRLGWKVCDKFSLKTCSCVQDTLHTTWCIVSDSETVHCSGVCYFQYLCAKSWRKKKTKVRSVSDGSDKKSNTWLWMAQEDTGRSQWVSQRRLQPYRGAGRQRWIIQSAEEQPYQVSRHLGWLRFVLS